MSKCGMKSKRGVVLIAALSFLVLLAVVVTAQLERLPFVSAESRSAARILQRELDEGSALQFVIGILQADAAASSYDSFADAWTRPQSVTIGTTSIELKISDSVFNRVPDDEWTRQDLGIPKGVSLVATEDLFVQDLFARIKPNINTASAAILRKSAGLNTDAVAWLKKERQGRAFTGVEDFRGAPDYDRSKYENSLSGVTFASSLFLAEATIKREGEAPERCYWALKRSGKDVCVLYSACGCRAR